MDFVVPSSVGMSSRSAAFGARTAVLLPGNTRMSGSSSLPITSPRMP
jgi:hypothetical protein